MNFSGQSRYLYRQHCLGLRAHTYLYRQHCLGLRAHTTESCMQTSLTRARFVAIMVTQVHNHCTGWAARGGRPATSFTRNEYFIWSGMCTDLFFPNINRNCSLQVLNMSYLYIHWFEPFIASHLYTYVCDEWLIWSISWKPLTTVA